MKRHLLRAGGLAAFFLIVALTQQNCGRLGAGVMVTQQNGSSYGGANVALMASCVSDAPVVGGQKVRALVVAGGPTGFRAALLLSSEVVSGYNIPLSGTLAADGTIALDSASLGLTAGPRVGAGVPRAAVIRLIDAGIGTDYPATCQ